MTEIARRRFVSTAAATTTAAATIAPRHLAAKVAAETAVATRMGNQDRSSEGHRHTADLSSACRPGWELPAHLPAGACRSES